MGKALVFSGINVENPLQTVTFMDSYPAITSYIVKLSFKVSKRKEDALKAFYDSLNNVGIWSKIRFLYPMFGSVADCAHGLVGDDITIPQGSTYDKGLNLTNASGGVGPAGNGILISSNYTILPKVTAMSCVGRAISGAVGTIFSTKPNIETPSDAACFIHGKSSTSVRFIHEIDKTVTDGYAKSCLIQTINITAEASGMTEEYYYNGESLGTKTYTGGGLTQKDSYRRWWLGGKLTVPSTDGSINMIAVFNDVLTSEEISTLYSAVTTLQNILFD